MNRKKKTKGINMEKLNPWRIESQEIPAGIQLNIINGNTGEIRQINLSVDHINHIELIGTTVIEKLADIYDKENTSKINKLLQFIDEKE